MTSTNEDKRYQSPVSTRGNTTEEPKLTKRKVAVSRLDKSSSPPPFVLHPSVKSLEQKDRSYQSPVSTWKYTKKEPDLKKRKVAKSRIDHSSSPPPFALPPAAKPLEQKDMYRLSLSQTPKLLEELPFTWVNMSPLITTSEMKKPDKLEYDEIELELWLPMAHHACIADDCHCHSTYILTKISGNKVTLRNTHLKCNTHCSDPDNCPNSGYFITVKGNYYYIEK